MKAERVTEIFPVTHAAMEAFVPAFNATRGLGFLHDCPASERAEWRRKHDEKRATRQATEQAYADELLPALLGGSWNRTDRYIQEARSRPGKYNAGLLSGGQLSHPV
jgi:hypothetical protein